MEVKSVVQRGNLLQAKFGVTNYNTPFTTKTSPEYIINGAAIFQVQVIAAQINNGHTNVYNNLIFIRFLKVRLNEEVTYKITVSSTELAISNKIFVSNDGTWHLINDNRKQQYTFDLRVTMDSIPVANSFAALHDDLDLTDFELRGADGSVRVHKAVLAASSPVLRRMLCGTWRETSEGHVDVPGTSKKTLNYFKDYVYLHVLPETGIENLLLLASYYMMPELEQKCVDKLVNNLTAENAYELLEFSAQRKLSRLMIGILECVQNGVIKVNDMRNHCLLGP